MFIFILSVKPPLLPATLCMYALQMQSAKLTLHLQRLKVSFAHIYLFSIYYASISYLVESNFSDIKQIEML